jgi:hypothetical protein
MPVQVEQATWEGEPIQLRWGAGRGMRELEVERGGDDLGGENEEELEVENEEDMELEGKAEVEEGESEEEEEDLGGESGRRRGLGGERRTSWRTRMIWSERENEEELEVENEEEMERRRRRKFHPCARCATSRGGEGAGHYYLGI